MMLNKCIIDDFESMLLQNLPYLKFETPKDLRMLVAQKIVSW